MTKNQDNTIKEFPAIGRYRVRILTNGNGQHVLDIREYISNSQTFEGFTRRGIRLTIPTETTTLASVLAQLEPAPASLKPTMNAGRKGGRR
jgi:hypothetical protein